MLTLPRTACNNDNRFVIYGLHLDGGPIRYVGLTSDGARNRLNGHIYGAMKRDTQNAVGRWIRKNGPESICLTVIEIHPDASLLYDREVFWIAFFHTYAHENPGGLNLTVGGEGVLGRVFTPEQLAAHTAAAKLRMSDPEYIERLKVSLRAAWATPEAKANGSAAQQKRYEKPEERQKHRDYALKRCRETDELERLRTMSLLGTHRQWHVKRNLKKPGCPHCDA